MLVYTIKWEKNCQHNAWTTSISTCLILRLVTVTVVIITFDLGVVCYIFLGGAVQQNGHTTAEIQEEVALTNMGTMATTEKRHSHVNNDKLHFSRANLQTITTLGKLVPPILFLIVR